MPASALLRFGGTSRYVIERELGHGGMGTVYQALDKERGMRVALKAITKSDALNIYRLKNEFRQLADISHPNLVSLHELVCEGDDWFFTMELVQGASFDEYVARPEDERLSSGVRASSRRARPVAVRELPPTLTPHGGDSEFARPRISCNLGRLRGAVRQLVEALSALHTAGKLHRDIKPSNVLVTREGRVVVLDFGLVSNGILVDPDEDAAETIGGNVFGTPAYMSPEQAAGEAVTTASDWYSLGVVLFEALTGQLPFDGSVLEILRQKEDEEAPAPSDIVSGVPDDLDQLCRALLLRNAHERPSGAEILRFLTGSSSSPPVFSATTSAPSREREIFVGREQHVAQLQEAFELVEDNKPVLALVKGLSGMGKSALVRCFSEDLMASGRAIVLRGRCYERESVPYKAFDNVIDALSRYMMQLPTDQAAELLPRNVHSLARLFPVLKRVRAIAQARTPKQRAEDPREVRNQAFGALKDLLLRISDYQPLVMQIDDLQWGDADSARLLLHLIDGPDAPGILFLGAYRRDEEDNSPFLRQVLGEGGIDPQVTQIVRVDVDALTSREAERLSHELLRDFPTANALFANTIAAEAEGVPFFIGELVQHVKAQTHGTPMPIGTISLDDVITERVMRMSPPAQRLLQVLSVAAGPLEQAVAMQAARVPSSDRASLLSLRAARLIRTRGTRQTDFAETYHDRVRETVVSRMSRDQVRDYHARIAEAIEAWGIGDPERLVDHYSEAGDGMRAGETAVQAAHAAAEKLAFNRAAQLYEKALTLLPEHDGQIDGLFVALASALANAGKSGASAEVYLRAADRAVDERKQHLLRMAAQQFLRSGREEQGMALATQLLADVGLRLPQSNTTAIAELLMTATRISMLGEPSELRSAALVPAPLKARIDTLGAIYQEISVTDPLRGALLQARFLEGAIRSREPGRMLQGLAWQAVHQSLLGGARQLNRANKTLSWARRILQDSPSREGTGLVHMAQAARMLFAGQFSDGIHFARQAEEIFESECTGRLWERSFASLLRYTALEFVGDLRALTVEAPLRARDAADRDDQLSTGLLTTAMSYSHLMGDAPEAALRFLEEQAQLLDPRHVTTLDQLVMVRTTDTYLYQGEGKKAFEYASTYAPRLRSSYLSHSRFMRSSVLFFEIRAALGGHFDSNDPKLLALARKQLKTLNHSNLGFAGYHDALLATTYQREGRLEEAVGRMRTALTHFEAPDVRGAIYARHRLGRLLGGGEGAAMVEAAEAALREQAIANPAAWVDMMFGRLRG